MVCPPDVGGGDDGRSTFGGGLLVGLCLAQVRCQSSHLGLVCRAHCHDPSVWLSVDGTTPELPADDGEHLGRERLAPHSSWSG